MRALVAEVLLDLRLLCNGHVFIKFSQEPQTLTLALSLSLALNL